MKALSMYICTCIQCACPEMPWTTPGSSMDVHKFSVLFPTLPYVCTYTYSSGYGYGENWVGNNLEFLGSHRYAVIVRGISRRPSWHEHIWILAAARKYNVLYLIHIAYTSSWIFGWGGRGHKICPTLGNDCLNQRSPTLSIYVFVES